MIGQLPSRGQLNRPPEWQSEDQNGVTRGIESPYRYHTKFKVESAKWKVARTLQRARSVNAIWPQR
jgi:hypothetical protein